jgi:hypothetical protein
MFIFPIDLLTPLPDLTVERLVFNPETCDTENHKLRGSYVVQNNKTNLWQAIMVEIDRSGVKSESMRVKILKKGRWVKGGHTAIAHAYKFENLS